MIPISGISRFRSPAKPGKSNKTMKTMPHSFQIILFVLLGVLPGPNLMSISDLSPVLKRTFCIGNVIIHSYIENEVYSQGFFVNID